MGSVKPRGQGAEGSPAPLRGPSALRLAAGPVLPSGGAQPGSSGSRSPPRTRSRRRGGRACSSSPGFCFPPGLTGPGSCPRSPTRPRPGACDRSRLEQAAGPAGRRVNSRCRGRERNFAFRGPGGGRSRARVSRAPGRRGRDGTSLTWQGPWRLRITECPAAAVLTLGFRSRGGGCGCAVTAFTCRPGTSDWEQHPRSLTLLEGASAAPILTGDYSSGSCKPVKSCFRALYSVRSWDPVMPYLLLMPKGVC